MTRRTFLIASIFLLIFSLSACKFSYEEIIDEMNSSFEPEVKKNSILEPGYNFSHMIPKNIYGVDPDELFQLTAPEGAEWYEWRLENSKIKAPKNDKDESNVISTERILACNLVDKGFLPNEKNRLESWVKVPGYPDPQHDETIVFLITRE
mgnify:FL=1